MDIFKPLQIQKEIPAEPGSDKVERINALL
jgi:hypothetical protein